MRIEVGEGGKHRIGIGMIISGGARTRVQVAEAVQTLRLEGRSGLLNPEEVSALVLKHGLEGEVWETMIWKLWRTTHFNVSGPKERLVAFRTELQIIDQTERAW